MKKKVWLSIIIGICIAISLAFMVVAIIRVNNNEHNDQDLETDDSEIEQEEDIELIVPENINLYFSDTNVSMNVTIIVQKDYTLKFENYDENIIDIENGVIKPNSIGETNVKTKLICGETIVEKTTKVCVYEDYYGVRCEIYQNDIKVDKLEFGKSYVAKFVSNTPLIGNPVVTSSNAWNFKQTQCGESFLCYDFDVTSYGKISFSFNFKNIENKFDFLVEEELTLDVYINDQIFNGNSYKLYIFNEEYIQQANVDGFYNKIKFNIISNSNFSYELHGENAEQKDDYIFAINEGEFDIEILVKEKIFKTIHFIVEKIIPKSIEVNDLSALVNQKVECEFSVIPVYSLYDYNLVCENENVEINDQTISSKTSGKYVINLIVGDVEKQFNFIVNNLNLNFEIPDTIIKANDIQIENNIIKIRFNTEFLFSLTYYFIDGNSEIIVGDYYSEIVSDDYNAVTNFSEENQRIIFKINQAYNFEINIYESLTNVLAGKIIVEFY